MGVLHIKQKLTSLRSEIDHNTIAFLVFKYDLQNANSFDFINVAHLVVVNLRKRLMHKVALRQAISLESDEQKAIYPGNRLINLNES